MRDIWSADIIHFLYEPHREIQKGGEIFNIHYPYISTSLQRTESHDSRKFTRTECRPFLLSFATVLVEIETGQLFPLSSDQKLPDAIRNEAKKFETKNENAYLAIQGCLNIVELPSSQAELQEHDEASQESDSDSDYSETPVEETPLEDVRNDIFKKVLRPMEVSCKHFSAVMGKPKHGPIEIPGPLRVGAVSATKVPIQRSRDAASREALSGDMLCFDDDVTPETDR
jgi:hypothetical protein